MRGICVAAVAALMLTAGCAQVGSSGGGDCTSHYEKVVSAPTKAALKSHLLRDVDPRAHSLRVFDPRPGDHKVAANLLNRRHRLVRSLDMWQRADGSWTAQQWHQCID